MATDDLDPDSFRRALGRFASGVTVVTTRTAAGGDYGMTASAFCSVSLTPPLILVCVASKNTTHAHLLSHRAFGVSLLASSQERLSNRFAGGRVGADGAWERWPAGQTTFGDLAFDRGDVSGAPLLREAVAALDCSLHEALPGGDHTIFVGRVHGARFPSLSGPLRPLLYYDGGYRRLADQWSDARAGLRVPDWFDIP